MVYNNAEFFRIRLTNFHVLVILNYSNDNYFCFKGGLYHEICM